MKMSLIIKTLALALVLAATVLTTGCAKTKENKLEIVEQLVADGHEDVMLFDYFTQIVGTEEKQGYYEVVLYAIPDNIGMHSLAEARMDIYTDGGLRSEKVESYTVPYAKFERCMEIVEEYKMDRWSELDDDDIYVIDGCTYVCKFPNGSQYMRVSSGQMPENGLEAFDAILQALQPEVSIEN
ncbi:MAG: hypothetical protein J5928_05360 [Firmicutes bacterium]|nr:hypothetical protein [Bacillota bacterium]